MSNKAYLVVEESRLGRESTPWLTPGGWFFMFEDGDVRLSGGYVTYHSTVGKCRQVLSERIAALRPLAGQLPCPELVEYLEELLLWLNDFYPEERLLADFGELDDLLLGDNGDASALDEVEHWQSGAGAEYLLPSDSGESPHAYAAFNVSQWMVVMQTGTWDRVEDGLRYIGIADDVWGDVLEGKGIVIGYEAEPTIDYRDDSGTDGPESRRLSPEEFLKSSRRT